MKFLHQHGVFIVAFVVISVFVSASAQVYAQESRQNSASQRASVARIVQDYHARGQFDGVVLIARHGKVIYETGVGLANRERKILNQPDTPYRICSITKSFTALLVMQLVQENEMKLDGVVTDYLPDFRADTGGKVTIQDLLTHTSGLPMPDDVLPEKFGVPGFYASTDPKFASALTVSHAYLTGDLKTPPGRTFRYNNGDYILLAAILERITGKPFGTLLQERILKPLGMRHTGLFDHDIVSVRQAHGYVSDKGTISPEPYYHIANFGAAGAMYSTLGDLLLWDNALDSNRLLGKKFTDLMFTPAASQANQGYEALGSWVYPASLSEVAKRPMLIERDGEIGGFITLNLRAPDDGYSVIIFSNLHSAQLGAIYMRQGMAYDIVRALYLPGN